MENMLADKSTSISLRDIDDAYVEAKAYYGNLLAGMDKDMLPLDDVEGKAEGKAQFFWSSDVDVQAVKEFCAQHDFTEKAFFNACFAYVLTKFTGRDEAFYATVYDGRNDAGSWPGAETPVHLYIEAQLRDGKAVFGCAYRSDCYSEELARSMLGSLAETAKEFLVKESLAEVSLLSKEAEAQLDRFNETEVP